MVVPLWAKLEWDGQWLPKAWLSLMRIRLMLLASSRRFCSARRVTASIFKTRRKPRHEAEGIVRLPQQQSTRIGGDRAAIERAHSRAALNGSKGKRLLSTLCQHRGWPFSCVKSLLHNNFR